MLQENKRKKKRISCIKENYARIQKEKTSRILSTIRFLKFGVMRIQLA